MGSAIRTLIALLSILGAMVSAAQAASDQFVFGGLTLGAQTSPDIVRMATGARCGAGVDGTQVCNGRIRMSPTILRINILINKSGTLQRIWLRFAARSYPRIYAEFVKAYGRPDQRQGETAIWLGDGGNAMLAKPADAETSESVIYFSTELDRNMKSRGGDVKVP